MPQNCMPSTYLQFSHESLWLLSDSQGTPSSSVIKNHNIRKFPAGLFLENCRHSFFFSNLNGSFKLGVGGMLMDFVVAEA